MKKNLTKKRRKKMTRNEIFAAVAALTLFACGCGPVSGGGDARGDRSNRIYREAMADYSAGRLDAAQKGFEKVIRSDPSNASARFQLACMLQDRKADYLAAYCGYQEYLLREPKSDKAPLARERAAICRTEAVRRLAKEMGLGDGGDSAGEAAIAKTELEKANKTIAKLEKALSESESRSDRLESENARLRRMMTSVGDEDAGPSAGGAISVADLLDEDDDIAPPRRAAPVSVLLPDDGGETVDMHGPGLEEAKGLGVDDSGSELLAGDRKPAATKLSEMPNRRKHKGDFGPADVKHPDSYVVQDGDTLYKIAVKFYGKASAWKKIRDANKATVSMDGRIQKGQRLVLP